MPFIIKKYFYFQPRERAAKNLKSNEIFCNLIGIFDSGLLELVGETLGRRKLVDKSALVADLLESLHDLAHGTVPIKGS